MIVIFVVVDVVPVVDVRSYPRRQSSHAAAAAVEATCTAVVGEGRTSVDHYLTSPA